jgi:hypothetical protein
MRLSACFLLTLSLAAADNVYQAPSPEPTAEETLILEFINRCRADPKADADRIAPAGSEPRLPSSTVIDFAMFRAEMATIKPGPPLVFDLRLLDAARKHSHYMTMHGLTHDEDPAKPGFTGRSFSERAKAAGFSGGGGGENCFATAPDPWGSHVGFIVDWGPGGTGGMQPNRGHRANITRDSFTLVGPGAVAYGGKLSVTHVFGRDGKRYAGGVVFVDKDRDAWYGLGEGRGGVTIEAGGQRAATWGSGAYAIEIPAGAGSLTLRAGSVSVTRPIPATPGNVKIDWIIPQEQDLAAADKLLAAVDAAKDPAAPAARKARIALLIGAEGLSLDDARAARVKELTDELASALAADRAAVREALAGEAKALKKTIDAHEKPWKGTVAAEWFAEAELYARASAASAAMPANASPTKLRGVAKELRAMATKSEVAEFRAKLEALARAAEAKVD